MFGTEEISMVATGEQTGETDVMLFRLAQYEEEALLRASKTYPSILRGMILLALAPLIILTAYHFFSGYVGTLMKWADPG
jgi:type II secretory pathway component PulF